MIEIYAMALFPLEEEKTFRENLRKISGERREKIRNLKNKKSQRQSLGAGLLLEYGLKKLKIQKGEISRTENGKLYVKNRDEIDFNISHSGEKGNKSRSRFGETEKKKYIIYSRTIFSFGGI